MSKKISDFPLRGNPNNLQIVGYDTLQEVRIPATKLISSIDISDSNSAISIHNSANTAHLDIRTKLRNYATANYVNNLVGDMNPISDYIHDKMNEWRSHPDWWDIEAIFQVDPDPNKRFILLVTDSDNSITLENTILGNSAAYFKTSDGQIYNTTTSVHTWDRVQDKPCSAGYKTRYVIVYSSDQNVSCNLSTLDVKYAYFGNSSIVSSLIADRINRILESIKVDSTVTTLSTSTLLFSSYSLISITIPYGVTSIENSAFSNCYSLISVTIPDSVTKIGDNAFSGCFTLASITIPNSVTKIEDNAFSGCYSLASITIPNRVTSIGDNAFSGCFILASITIPSSVESIENYAFNGCYSLASIIIPNSVTTIGYNAFNYCHALLSINIEDGWVAPTFNIPRSPLLSVSSILDMFNKLGTAPTARTITLGAINLAKLTPTEKAIALNKGYTLA